MSRSAFFPSHSPLTDSSQASSSAGLRQRVEGQWAIVAVAILSAFVLIAAPAMAKKKDKGVIEGEVQDQEGNILAGIQVKVIDADTQEAVEETVTDRQGKFSVKISEPSGEYLVAFSGEGYSSFEGRVELEESRQQTLSVKLIDEAAAQENVAIQAYNEGAAAHRSGDLDTALAKFQEAAAGNPELSEPLLGIADIHLQQGRPEEAVTAVEAFLALEPDDEQGRKLAFEAYRRAGMTEKAKSLADELGNPDMSADIAIGIYNEGALASSEGDYEAALAKFSKAAELDPNLGQAHAGVASIHYNQGQYEEALVAADRAVQVDPKNAQGLRIRFLVLDVQGNLDASLEAWDVYRELDEDGAVDLLYRRASMDFESGEADRARLALEKVLALRPDFARAHYTLGLVLSASDAAQAKVHLAKFIELAPDDPEAESAKEIMQHL